MTLRRITLLLATMTASLLTIPFLIFCFQETAALDQVKVPVREVSINGPKTGDVGETYDFTAIITPNNANPPIRYNWSPEPLDGQRRRTAQYMWTTPGEKIIYLTASNKEGLASTVHTITIEGPGIPINSVKITGTASGILYQTDSFTATISPVNATPPIDYIWSPTPLSGQNSSIATFRWIELGENIITVTASNEIGAKVATHHVNVTSILIRDVGIIGPYTGTINQSVSFTTLISPAEATRPVTCTWLPEPTSGQNSPNATYTWNTVGDKTITVKVENIGSYKTDTHHITIVPGPVQIEDAGIVGPETGFSEVPYIFTATVEPVYATSPINFIWSPKPMETHGSNAVYEWSTAGTKTISVTADNELGSATSARNIIIKTRVFLPMLLRDWPPLPDTPILYGIPLLDPGCHDYPVMWKGWPNADDYILEEATNCAFEDGERIYTDTMPYYVVSANPPSRYFYHVKGRNKYGEGAWSNVKSIDVLWELDENTWGYQANGPLVSGVAYYGYPDKKTIEYPGSWDCFYFETNREGVIQVDLTNARDDGVQLLLYYPSIAAENLVGRCPNPNYPCITDDVNYTITHKGPAGQYFACIYSLGNNTSISYTLRAAFPYAVYSCENR